MELSLVDLEVAFYGMCLWQLKEEGKAGRGYGWDTGDLTRSPNLPLKWDPEGTS